MKKRTQFQTQNPQNRAMVYSDTRHDTYQSQKKLNEPTVCTLCGSVYKNGRWTWDPVPEDYYEAVCSACSRESENYPAGTLELSGSFFRDHKDEILGMVKNVEKKEKSLHPLERIMKIEINAPDSATISTTGMHIAHRIANNLFDAYKGELKYSYEGETFVRIDWNRP
jgi:NMD protein affecting ribosome stability and mRNA decay